MSKPNEREPMPKQEDASPKPRYETPLVIDLCQIAQGNGLCELGSADATDCVDGSTAGIVCNVGFAVGF